MTCCTCIQRQGGHILRPHKLCCMSMDSIALCFTITRLQSKPSGCYSPSSVVFTRCPATKQHAGMSATSFAHHMLPSVPNRRITNVCDAGDMLHRSVPVATSDQRMHIMAVGTCLCSKHGGGPHQPLLLTIKPATPATHAYTVYI